MTPSVSSVHLNDVIMGAIASQITSLTIVYSTVYSHADQKNIKAPRTNGQQRGKCFHLMTSSCILLHKAPVKRKPFPYHDVIVWLISKLIQIWHISNPSKFVTQINGPSCKAKMKWLYFLSFLKYQVKLHESKTLIRFDSYCAKLWCNNKSLNHFDFQNSAVFWYNINKSGTRDHRTLHAGCPVLIGEKWGRYTDTTGWIPW